MAAARFARGVVDAIVSGMCAEWSIRHGVASSGGRGF